MPLRVGLLIASTSIPLSDWEVPEDRQNLIPLSLQPGAHTKPEVGRRTQSGREGRQEAMKRVEGMERKDGFLLLCLCRLLLVQAHSDSAASSS